MTPHDGRGQRQSARIGVRMVPRGAQSLLEANGGLVTDPKSRYILYPWSLYSPFLPHSASELGAEVFSRCDIDG